MNIRRLVDWHSKNSMISTIIATTVTFGILNLMLVGEFKTQSRYYKFNSINYNNNFNIFLILIIYLCRLLLIVYVYFQMIFL